MKPIEEGFTKIQNTILDKLCCFHLFGEEARVFYVILRKTCGYHKKEDKIALSQFKKETDMDKRNIVRAIRKLENRSVIFVTRDSINRYEINENVNEWQGAHEPPDGGRTRHL